MIDECDCVGRDDEVEGLASQRWGIEVTTESVRTDREAECVSAGVGMRREYRCGGLHRAAAARPAAVECENPFAAAQTSSLLLVTHAQHLQDLPIWSSFLYISLRPEDVSVSVQLWMS